MWVGPNTEKTGLSDLRVGCLDGGSVHETGIGGGTTGVEAGSNRSCSCSRSKEEAIWNVVGSNPNSTT